MALPKIASLSYPSDSINKENEVDNRYNNSFMYDYNKKLFVRNEREIRKNSNIDSIRDWIDRNVRTLIDTFPVLTEVNSGFGTEIEGWIGESFNENEAFTRFSKELKRALPIHPKINNVVVTEVDVNGTDLVVSYTVYLVDGESLEGELTNYS